MENFFISAALVVGIAQVVDAIFLYRRRGLTHSLAMYFSLFEYLWAAACLCLLFVGGLGASRWLAYSFLVYIPSAVILALLVDARGLVQPSGAVRVPMATVYFGGLYGVLYAGGAGILRAGA